MNVWVVFVSVVILASVNRKRIRQTRAFRQRLEEISRHVDLIVELETARQCEIAADVEATIRAFVQIRGVPVLPGIAVSPGRHVAGFDVERAI